MSFNSNLRQVGMNVLPVSGSKMELAAVTDVIPIVYIAVLACWMVRNVKRVKRALHWESPPLPSSAADLDPSAACPRQLSSWANEWTLLAGSPRGNKGTWTSVLGCLSPPISGGLFAEAL
jgi:hypothetical protein